MNIMNNTKINLIEPRGATRTLLRGGLKMEFFNLGDVIWWRHQWRRNLYFWSFITS